MCVSACVSRTIAAFGFTAAAELKVCLCAQIPRFLCFTHFAYHRYMLQCLCVSEGAIAWLHCLVLHGWMGLLVGSLIICEGRARERAR